jgi:hypothetical protein
VAVRIAPSASAPFALLSPPPPRLLASETEQCYDVSAGVRALGPRTRPEVALNRVHTGAKSLQRVTGTARMRAEIDEGGTARTRETDQRTGRHSRRSWSMEGCDGLDPLFLARSHCGQPAKRACYERGDDLGRRGRMTCSGGSTAARYELRHSEKAQKGTRGSLYVLPGVDISTMESMIRAGNALVITRKA